MFRVLLVTVPQVIQKRLDMRHRLFVLQCFADEVLDGRRQFWKFLFGRRCLEAFMVGGPQQCLLV